jgi:hypothetical protein
MSKDNEIRAIAYRIWEEEGRPEGREIEHWRRAEAIWQEQSAQSATEAEATDPTSKPVQRRKRSAPKSPRKSRRQP